MEKIIRPLYPVTTVEFGGVETFIRQTALLHDPMRIKPIYCFLREGPLQDWMQRETSHEVHVCPFPIRLSRPITLFRGVSWLRSQAQASSADLIHSSMAYTALIGSLAAILCRRPHIWFQHGPVAGWMDRLAGVLPARAILYNSHYTLARQKAVMRSCTFIQKLFQPRMEHHVLHLGASAPAESDKKTSTPKIHIGMLCRFQRWKGVEIFIRAVSLAREQLNQQELQASIWGDPVPGQDGIEYAHEVDQLCKKHSVIRHPHTSNPEQAIQTLDLLVNASTSPEPFGLTLVEAMLAGVVPIAPRWGGPLEIIEDNQTGLLFEPLNAADLAAKIVDLVQHPEKRIEMSVKSSEVARQKFTAENTIRNLEKIYSSILSKR